MNSLDKKRYFKVITALIGKQEHSKALTFTEKALKAEPDCSLLWCKKATVLLYLKREREIWLGCKRIEKTDSEFGLIWRQRISELILELKEYQKALIFCEETLKIISNYHPALFYKGKALQALEQYSAAVSAYERAVRIKPDHPFYWYNAGGVLYYCLKEYPAALEWYETAIEYHPNNDFFWYFKGLALYKLNRYRESIIALEKAITINPNNTEAIALQNKISQNLN